MFTENGQQRPGAEAELASWRGAPTARDMERPGADLIAHYLDPTGSGLQAVVAAAR